MRHEGERPLGRRHVAAAPHQKPQRSRMTDSDSTEHTSRGIMTSPPLASMAINAVT
jgi:hypothetical protein